MDALTSEIETLLANLEDALSKKKPFIRIEEDIERKLVPLKKSIDARAKMLSECAMKSNRGLNANGDLWVVIFRLSIITYASTRCSSYGELFLAHTGFVKQLERFRGEMEEIKRRQLMATPVTQSPEPASSSGKTKSKANLLTNTEASNIQNSILRGLYTRSRIYQFSAAKYWKMEKDQDTRLDELGRLINLNKETSTVIGQELDKHVKIIGETSNIASRLQDSVSQGNTVIANLNTQGLLSKISTTRRECKVFRL